MFMINHIPHNLVNYHFNNSYKQYKNNIMIQNIVILLVANTIIPLIPVPPEIFTPVPLAHFLVAETSVYEHMNLSRLHTQQEFKKSFRQSLKALHPDRGGSQEAFSKVKNLKKIMEQKTNYYDTLNITDVDLQYNIPMKDIVSIKQTTYFVQTGIFYFIILLYGLAFTIDDDLKPSRKYIIPLTFIFGLYELYIHYNPQVPTVIDFVNDKVPIFVQKTILKNIVAVLVAAIRTKFLRRKTPEKKLLDQLDKNQLGQQYQNLLQKLTIVFQEKAQAKKKAENSWGAKIRDWISKGFSLLVLFSLIKGFMGE